MYFDVSYSITSSLNSCLWKLYEICQTCCWNQVAYNYTKLLWELKKKNFSLGTHYGYNVLNIYTWFKETRI